MTTHTAYGAACAAVLAIASLSAGAAQTNDQPTMRFVQSNGIRMCIAEMGTGPLVLLRGRDRVSEESPETVDQVH